MKTRIIFSNNKSHIQIKRFGIWFTLITTKNESQALVLKNLLSTLK